MHLTHPPIEVPKQPTGLQSHSMLPCTPQSPKRLTVRNVQTLFTSPGAGRPAHPQGPKQLTGWNALLSTGGNDLYVKRNAASQGTSVYALKCQELGVVPSSQVVQQLQVRVKCEEVWKCGSVERTFFAVSQCLLDSKAHQIMRPAVIDGPIRLVTL
eukprot:364775-Chlamydomonas_euryale.AAC.7